MGKLYSPIAKTALLVVGLVLSFNVKSQTTFAELGSSDSGGSGFKTVANSPDFVVSNVMGNYSGSTWMHTETNSDFTIKAYGVDDFTFEGMNFYCFTAPGEDVTSSSTVTFKDKFGTTIQIMRLNATKLLPNSNTSLASFFDTGATTPINNVAEIIFHIRKNLTDETMNFIYSDITISSSPPPTPTVTTTAASSISLTSANLGGNVTDQGGSAVIERGIVYSTTDATPTIAEGATKDINGSGTGVFSKSIGSLSKGTTYYYNAYAINTEGTAYGSEKSFSTLKAPTITTQAVTSITATTATGKGNITDLGVPNPSAHGVCWNTTQNPTTTDSKDDKGAASVTGAFTASITGLSAGTTYYVRAFATNDAGTVYGSQVSFTTNTPPTVANRTFSDIHKGNVYPNIGKIALDYGDADGDDLQNIRISAVPENGTLFSDPNNNNSIDAGEAIAVNDVISRDHINWGYIKYLNTDGVSSSFTYEANDGTDYSNTATVTLTVEPTPRVTFTNISQTINESTATITITAQLSEAINYTNVTVPFSVNVSSSATGDGEDYSITGSPITIIAGLSSNTINISVIDDDLDEQDETVVIDMGEPTNAAKGTTTTFTETIQDNDDIPSVTTQAVTSISATTVTGNGTITNLGTSSPITQYGVCWNTSGSPTIADSKTQEGSTSATGAFTSSLTSLSEGTTYYVRAYAVSAAGTAYGGEVSFKTNASPAISIDNTTLGYTENDAATPIDAAATVSDADGDAEWDGGKLGVQITANNESGDEVSIHDTDGDATAITINSFNIFANGTDIGDLSASGGIVTNGTKLTITFASAATNANVQEVLQSLRYRNTSDSPGTSNRTITISATDKNSASVSDTRIVSVTPVNDDPTISGLPTDITVSEDIASNVDLSASTLSDVDAGANSIVLTVEASAGTLTAGSGGSVTIGGSGTGTLSLTGAVVNIDTYLNTASNIKYTGALNVNGNNAATLTLTANDGGYTGSGGGTDVSLGTVNIDITAVNDAPSINTNNGLPLNEGATGTITSATHLSATDVDNDEASLVFTITTNTSNGAVKKSGTTLNLNDTFTQVDLTAGTITYTHDGTNTTSDSFVFKVSDGSAELTNQTFSISVTAIDDDTPTITTNNGLTLNEGATKAITLTELEANDADTDNASLTFTVTSAPSNGQLENTDAAGNSILSFTQQHLIDGKIQYVHDGSNTTFDSFTFKVADGTPNELTNQTFSISVTAVDDDTPTMTTNNGLTLNEGATKAITLTELEANDADTDNASLTFTVTSAPTNGQLENTDDVGNSILSFTQQHLIDGKIQYVHDGSNTTSDSFTFKVADGTPNELTNQTFTISVTAIDDDTPTISTNNGLTLNEGATKAITLTELEANDADTDNASLTFTVTSAPTNGQLENTDDVGNSILSFTQQHLIDGKIQYVHDGSNTTSDSFTFKIADGTPNELTEQNFSITINAINDAPLLTTNTGLLLDEGATATLEKTKLNATDSDDNGTGLIYTLTTSVAHGSLFLDSNDNGNADDNTETILSGETFTQEDIDNGKLKYIHNDSENFSDSFQFSLADGGEDGVSPIAGTFTFSINKINDNNPAVKADQSFNLDENAATLSSVGTVLAADEDTETTFSNWTIVGGNVNNAFTINPSSGEITVNNSTALDWETIKMFELSITVSDGTSTSLPETVTVTLNDVFEKLDQNIAFSQLASRTYGDADFNLIATASSGLPVSYSSSNTSVATIAGNTVTILGAGSTSITASQSGNSTYNSATNVVRTLSVNKASQSIDFSLSGSITIDEGSITLVASSTSNLSVVFSSSDEEVATIDENTLNLVTPGVVNIKANQAGNNNYLPAPEVTIQLEVLPSANKAPVFENQTITLLENSPAETLILELQAEDPDNDAITFSILEGNDNEAFKIEENQLLVNNSDALNLENHSVFELTVRADDGQAHTDAVITIQLEEDPSVGIDPALSVRFTLAPNPCSDVLHLTFANPTYGEAKLAVYSLKGEKVISKSFNLKEDQTLNVSKLTPGVYILIIQQDQLVIRKRWIKI